MRPAFSSTKQAAAFAILLLVVLSLPAVMGKSLLPSREAGYAAQGCGSGPFGWIQNQIFQERTDIDIALVGSSHILHCLDARRVQADLSLKLGRPAVVRVIGWGGGGFDALYFITRDLLEHRRVRLLVFYNEANNEGNDPGPNGKSPAWFRWADDADALRGLPWSGRAYFYFAALVGMPRNLLALTRSDLPLDLHSATPSTWEEHYRASNIADNLGSTTSELGFDSRPKADCDSTIPFTPFSPATTASVKDACVYTAATAANFDFSTAPLPAWQEHFSTRLLALAREHGCRMALLHVPILNEARRPAISERGFWRENAKDDLFLLGIPPAKMFAGLTDDEIRKLYFNSGHLNKNGQALFTSLIEPALIQLYESQFPH